CHPVNGQDQHIADSLARIYRTNTFKGNEKLELLRNLTFNEVNDLKLSLQYAEELISLSAELKNDLYLCRGYLQKGNKHRLLGNLDESLVALFKSVSAAQQAKYIQGVGSAFVAIGDTYSAANNHQNAMVYYYKAIDVLKNSAKNKADSIALGGAISNAGDAFLDNKNFDSALIYFNRAGEIFDKVDYTTGKAYNLGNNGMVYAQIGQDKLAEKSINEAIPMLEKLEDYYPISVYLLSLSDIYLARGDISTALGYATRSLNLAKKYHLNEQVSEANLKLSDLYSRKGNIGLSFNFYKEHILYRDSLNDIKSVQKMYDLRTDFEVSQMQTKFDMAKQVSRNQRNMILSLVTILGLITVLSVTLLHHYKTITKEKKLSESLLLNILPAETAAELKQNGKVHAVKFEQVTVLFTDFIEFSKLAEKIDPEQLVQSIDFYFTKFDEITTRYGL
ncbi:MAG: adenylate/guanylate cyclase domain-containing protein, partial [Chitinophagaceae bacterium]